MKIVDTVPYFLINYQPSIPFLRSYYQEFSDIFKEYFLYHCKDTDERHRLSLSKYPSSWTSIQVIHEKIIALIKEMEELFNNEYQVTLPVDVNLIVGGYGSNAYTYRQIIPNVTFALEKLSPDSNHLRIIIAHEFGHLTHNILSDNAGINWREIDWNSPFTWLFQEGAAIHFSKKIVPGLSPSVYFSFNDSGEEWLEFAHLHKQEIKDEFARAIKDCTSQEVFKEWFSVNGGEKFGFSRLAYFIGDMFFQDLVAEVGELNAITAWKNNNFRNRVQGWLGNAE